MIIHLQFIPKNSDGLVTSNSDDFYVKALDFESFGIVLYNNNSEPNRVNKTEYLQKYADILGSLRDSCSIINPTITFEFSSFPTFNYAYIPIFNRYYFVDSIVSVRKNLWEISLSIDPLMTYKENILKQKAFIARNEFTFNPDIVDNSFPLKMGYDFEAIQGNKTIFENIDYENSYCCVLSGICEKSALAP